MVSPWNVVELFEKPKGNSDMSVAEADKCLRTAGYLRGDWDYLKDHHFAQFIYLDINSLEDVEALLVRLDKDNEDHTNAGPFRWGCSKATSIRSWLKNEFWRESVDHLRSALATNRRIMCSCHESGSFRRRDGLPRDHEEKFKGLMPLTTQSN